MGNLVAFGKTYDIPISIVYKRGPYIHTVVSNYEKAATSLAGISSGKIDALLARLQTMADYCEKEESQFYSEVGVSGALDFSQKYLLAEGVKLSELNEAIQRTIHEKSLILSMFSWNAAEKKERREKWISSIRNNLGKIVITSRLGEEIKDFGAKLSIEEFEKKLIEGINEKWEFKRASGRGNSVQAKRVVSTGNKILSGIQKLTGEEVVTKIDFDARAERAAATFRELLKKNLSGKKEISNSLIEQIVTTFKTEIRNLGPIFNEDLQQIQKAENESVFKGFEPAEGALEEIGLKLTIKDNFSLKPETVNSSVELLANDTVKEVKKIFNVISGDVEILQSEGRDAYRVYKSPTDITITIGGRTYGFQVKASQKNIESEGLTLKLQNRIKMPTFLGNIAASGILDTDTLKLLVYHIANQGIDELKGAGSGEDFILNILTACIEYYTESETVHSLEYINGEAKVVGNNYGNLFFIYQATYLVPISEFLYAAIRELKNNDRRVVSSLVGNKPPIEYSKTSSIEDIRTSAHGFNQRIAIGNEIYSGSKITSIEIAMHKILASIDSRIGVKVPIT